MKKMPEEEFNELKIKIEKVMNDIQIKKLKGGTKT